MTSALIDLNAITRTFGAFTALDGVTVTLPPGRIGLLGPNGAGKCTLVKILMGLISPSTGTGRVLDQNLGGDRTALQTGNSAASSASCQKRMPSFLG